MSVLIDLLYFARDCHISAAILPRVLLKKGHANFRVRFTALPDLPQFLVQLFSGVLIQLNLLLRQPGALIDRVLIPRQRSKRGKLCRTVCQRHLRMTAGDMVRQRNNVLIFRYSGFLHALCPPIWLLRSTVVAPSCRFVPFRMAFFPYFFFTSSIAS